MMAFLKRLVRYVPIILSQELSVETIFKLIALLAHEPCPDGSSSRRPSIFVYTMY